MGDGRRIDDADQLQRGLPAAAEEPNAVAEQHRDEVNLDLVEESRGEELLDDVTATGDGDVPVAGGDASLLQAASTRPR
jgi:hypothetical protein